MRVLVVEDEQKVANALREGLEGERYEVVIMDMIGNVVRTESIVANSGTLIYVWNGRAANDMPAVPGTYIVNIIDRRTIRSAKAVLIH